MNDKQFSKLIEKITLLSRLLAMNLLKDVKTKKAQILILSSYGFTPVEISQILGITPKYVHARLSEAKKSKK